MTADLIPIWTRKRRPKSPPEESAQVFLFPYSARKKNQGITQMVYDDHHDDYDDDEYEPSVFLQELIARDKSRVRKQRLIRAGMTIALITVGMLLGYAIKDAPAKAAYDAQESLTVKDMVGW